MSREIIHQNKQGGQAVQASRPCVMVCLSPSPSNRRVIRAASRLASQAGPAAETGMAPGINPCSPEASEALRAAELSACSATGAPIALYVGSTGYEEDEDSRLRENIQYARMLGFEVHTVQGGDIPLAISESARRAGVTDLFIGYSPPSFFFQAKRGISEKLQSYLPAVDIHIIPDQVSSPYPAAMQALHKAGDGVSWNLPDLVRVLIIMAVATLSAAWFYQSRFSNANIITIYILAVLIASVMTSSRIYGLFAAVLYVLLFNFLFIDPRYTLLVYDSTYLMTYLVTIVAALITGTVAVRMKNIAHISAENAYQAKILLDTSNKLEMAAGSEDIVHTTCMQLVHLLNRNILFFPPDYRPDVSDAADLSGASPAAKEIPAPSGGTAPASPAAKDTPALSGGAPRFFPAGGKNARASLPLSGREQEAILRAMESRDKSGSFTSSYPDCRCQYLSIYSGPNLFGLVGIEMGGRPFSEFENTILLSILHECTMALENTRMEQEQKKAEIQAENERLRAGLLRSLSHDLRTPLTSIYGNASNLRSYERDLPRSERDKIYEDIMEDAGWLNLQFENILSMTKLENAASGNGSGLQTTVENMEDVIEESLRHIAPHPAHRILFERTDQLLFAKMDPKLIMQVLINLLNNAVKYTPSGSTVHVRAMLESQESLRKAAGPGRKDSPGLSQQLPQVSMRDTSRGLPASPAVSKERILVEVADNGPGIPDEDKPHVFELFYTGRHALEDSYRSMGLGLNLCAQIVRAHGGTMEVDDNVPCGAVFRFRLPSADISLAESETASGEDGTVLSENL